LTDQPPQSIESDAELVVRCQHHDPTAFRLLVERYRRRAWKVAYNLVGDLEIARDISQEAFVRVIRGMAGCDPRRGFRQWFDRVVVNLSIDYLRKQRGVRLVPLEFVSEPPTHGDDPETLSVRDEARRLVHEVLADLPVKHRAVLVMRDIEGRDCEDIARVLGKSPGTVRWRLSRARQAFKRAWERREVSGTP
jgi:RNA polymerase sigma-70 factor (ECF subfamily)